MACEDVYRERARQGSEGTIRHKVCIFDFLATRIDSLAIWLRPWNAHVDPTSRGFYEERISGVTSQDLQIFTRNADILPSSSSTPINEEACCFQTVLHDFWVCFVTSF